jgi:hypothetical protein
MGGACASVTVQKYAERRQWTLRGVHVDVSYARVPAEDYGKSATNIGMVDRIDMGVLSMATYLRTYRPGCSRLPRGVPSIACWFRKSRFARSCLFPFLRRAPSGVAAVITEQGSSTVLNGTQGGLSQISPSSGRTGLLPYVA